MTSATELERFKLRLPARMGIMSCRSRGTRVERGGRQSAGLGAEEQGIARLEARRTVGLRAARLDAEERRGSECREAAIETRVDAHGRELLIIEAGAAHGPRSELEAEWLHEVQGRARVGGEADDVAGVGRDLGLDQHDVEHGLTTGGIDACAIMPAMASLEKDAPAGGAAAAATPLALEFCGLEFASPIVLLSGCVGFGEEYTRIEGFSNRDAGAIVLKGTTGTARLGNPPHRVSETPAGMLNAIGLQNPGVDHVVRVILPQLDFGETRFIANVSGSTIEEYVEVTRRFDASPIDAIEINISCPNVKEGGVAFGNYPDMSAQVVAACRRVTTKPLITKLSPNQTDIRENARRCIEAGSDALAVINTVMGMAIDVEERRPVIGNVQGGLSGPAIKPIALLKVHQVHEVAGPHRVPIIGQGGITTAQDALEFIIAGATAIGVGTALFYDPLVCRRINEGIAAYLAAHGLANVTELIGTLRTAKDLADCALSG